MFTKLQTLRVTRLISEAANHYEVLGVSSHVDDTRIKAAHRALASGLHTDRNKVPAAEDALRSVNAAYAVLGDKESRRKYTEEIAYSLSETHCGTCNGAGVVRVQKGAKKNVVECQHCGGSGLC